MTSGPLRWLFHVVAAEDLRWGEDGRYRPPSFEREGFVHASFRDAVLKSARLYFPPDARLSLLAIDPRRLDVPVDVVETPRGPMPHVMDGEGAATRMRVASPKRSLWRTVRMTPAPSFRSSALLVESDPVRAARTPA